MKQSGFEPSALNGGARLKIKSIDPTHLLVVLSPTETDSLGIHPETQWQNLHTRLTVAKNFAAAQTGRPFLRVTEKSPSEFPPLMTGKPCCCSRPLRADNTGSRVLPARSSTGFEPSMTFWMLPNGCFAPGLPAKRPCFQTAIRFV